MASASGGRGALLHRPFIRSDDLLIDYFSFNVCNNLWVQNSGLNMPWSLQSLMGDDDLELEPKSPEEKKAEREAKQKELDAKLAQGFGLPDPPPHKPAPKGGAAEALMWSGLAACEPPLSPAHLRTCARPCCCQRTGRTFCPLTPTSAVPVVHFHFLRRCRCALFSPTDSKAEAVLNKRLGKFPRPDERLETILIIPDEEDGSVPDGGYLEVASSTPGTNPLSPPISKLLHRHQVYPPLPTHTHADNYVCVLATVVTAG